MNDSVKIKRVFNSKFVEDCEDDSDRITLRKALKNSFVITDKGDRFNVFSRRFREAFDYVPTPYIGFFGGRKVDCLTYSHAGIIRTALIMGLPFVMIFEDDAAPLGGMEEEFDSFMMTAPDDARCLIVGYLMYHGRHVERNLENWKKMKDNTRGVAGSHAYIVFKSAYEDFINSCNKKLREADRCWDYMSPVYVSKRNFFIQVNEPGHDFIHVCRHPKTNGYIV